MQDVGANLQLHIANASKSPTDSAYPKEYCIQLCLADQQGRNVSHLCFNGYLQHLGSHMSGGNRDTYVPREVQDKIHRIYETHTKHTVYKEKIWIPILYH